MTLGAPEPLTERHDGAAFDSGRETLDVWLRRRALRNQVSGASRTYVVCEGGRIVAYYALASGAVSAELATGRLRRNMPDPIPVVLLARLAVSRSHQCRGLGRALLQDAGRRVLSAADVIGIRGLLVQAIDDEARVFYAHIGFDPSPLDPMTLMITLADLRASLSG
ncbi:GNAT family N-acetyltransferase [Thiococcus pfennigii]|uniref:GNAT family N-acetyltransferase n=1 Tax=Thiococcus pfennigii TaxID=1057 RepID=UPI0030B8C122|nr:GNAT family N-acetyltransferase [Thiococcus pfennigii]MBK1732338.1 GNAT family N-acetyltransferase [Thiococcus pfennigii]